MNSSVVVHSPLSRSQSLGDLLQDAEVFNDGDWVESKDQDPSGDVRLVQLADIGDGTFVNKSQRFMTSAKAKQLRCTFLKSGDVLVARMPDPIGRACIFPGVGQSAVTVVDVCIVRPSLDRVEPKWLVHCLNSPTLRQQIATFTTGTTRLRISTGNIAKLFVDVPPLAEQRRIAAILDKADALRAKRREAIAKLDQLLQSVFLKMFGDPVTNPKNWLTMTLADIGEWRSGGTPSRTSAKNFEGDIPWYSSGELNQLFVGESDEHISQAALAASAAKMIRPGSLLLGMYDTAAFKSSITTVPATCNQAIAFAELDQKRCSTLYVYQAIQLAKEHYKRLQRGVRQKNFNLSMIRETPMQMPPIELQKRFAEVFTRQISEREKQQRSLKSMDRLFASLQESMFEQ